MTAQKQTDNQFSVVRHIPTNLQTFRWWSNSLLFKTEPHEQLLKCVEDVKCIVNIIYSKLTHLWTGAGQKGPNKEKGCLDTEIWKLPKVFINAMFRPTRFSSAEHLCKQKTGCVTVYTPAPHLQSLTLPHPCSTLPYAIRTITHTCTHLHTPVPHWFFHYLNPCLPHTHRQIINVS